MKNLSDSVFPFSQGSQSKVAKNVFEVGGNVETCYINLLKIHGLLYGIQKTVTTELVTVFRILAKFKIQYVAFWPLRYQIPATITNFKAQTA